MPKDKNPKKESQDDIADGEDAEMAEDPTSSINQLSMRFNMMAKDTEQLTTATATRPNAPNLLRRFKINLRLISLSHKNKLSTRFQEVDRLFVCRKTKEQRVKMGIEFQDIKLTDVYIKSNPHKVSQKYGQQILCQTDFEKEINAYRTVSLNPAYTEPVIKPEDEVEEEKLLDEQKIFQSLHEALEELKKKYNKTTEYISELFVRVCGDLNLVEQVLQGKNVPQWTYLEDLALTKPIDTQEYQWLLKSKGQKEIHKRRKFLLTADSPEESMPMTNSQGSATAVEDEQIQKQRREQEEEDLMHDPNIDETVPYL